MARPAHFYPLEFVAKVKGLMLLGLSVKAAASIAGVSYYTAREWRTGTRNKHVEPDQGIRDFVQKYMQVPCGTRDSVVSGKLRSAQTLPAASGSETGRLP